MTLLTVDIHSNCGDALQQMILHEVHHLGVTDQAQPIGTVSDRDIFFKWLRSPKSSDVDLKKLPILPLVRTNLPIVKSETDLAQALRWMQDLRISALLSKTADGQWGIITERDLLTALNKILSQTPWKANLIARSEVSLASPWVQKVLQLLAQSGI